ncbi:MAG: hypothetical protein KGI69_00045 [Patescibacteria group bacterium]|nr:hypothetical protein [Patescibacteria group bacterium]
MTLHDRSSYFLRNSGPHGGMSRYAPFFIAIIALYAAALAVPPRASAQANTFDGGALEGISSMCSCSGGEVVSVKSYVDKSIHHYLYQPGVTRLYANYDIVAPSGYVLTTLLPYAICLDSSTECEGSSGPPPEGIFILTGTSFKLDASSVLALLGRLPLASQVSSALSGLAASVPSR